MDFGYIHYETAVPKDMKGIMRLKEVRDYAVVIVDGQILQSLDRRHRQDRLEVDLRKGQRLEILVENVGRVNYGPEQIFDDDDATYWHSQWMASRKPFPHTLIIDLGEIQTVTAVQMRQRGATSPGTVKDFTLYGRPQFFLFRNSAAE